MGKLLQKEENVLHHIGFIPVAGYSRGGKAAPFSDRAFRVPSDRLKNADGWNG
jgi:hypothetical protein